MSPPTLYILLRGDSLQLFGSGVSRPHRRQNRAIGNILQHICYPHKYFLKVVVKISTATMEEVDETKETIRGKRGFGSTGLSEEIKPEKLEK